MKTEPTLEQVIELYEYLQGGDAPKGFNNSSMVKLIRIGKTFATVSTLDGLIKWDTMLNRLSPVHTTTN